MTQFNIDEQKSLSRNIKKITYQLNKDLKNLEKNLQIYTSSDNCIENDESENITNFLMKEEPNILLKERDNELDKIVKGVSNLHEMFKDMTILVNEQGTILDRIDYNIDIGYDNVSRGKKKLHEANESKKGSCFRNAIMLLMLFVFIESMLILNKLL